MKWLLLGSGGVRLRPDAAESEPLSVRLGASAFGLFGFGFVTLDSAVFVYDILSTYFTLRFFSKE